MALLDKILALLGTNRTRMEWKLRAWRRGWDRRFAATKNRAQNLTYAHQTCPKCSHPAGADEKVCTRCGEALGGRIAHRARRAFGFLWAEGTPVVATVLVAAIVACYAAMLLWDSRAGLTEGIHTSPTSLALIRFGSLITPSVAAGEWWRLVTSTFLHLDVMHLVMNVLSLWTVAVFLEDTIGKAKTLALYLVLGFGASLASYVWHTSTGPGIGHSAGASGAICGLIGVAIGFAFRKRNVARHLRGHYIGWAIWILILALSPWPIDNAAHFGGLVLGFACGFVVRRKAEGSSGVRRAWAVAALAAVGGTAAAIAVAMAHPLPAGWLGDAPAAAGIDMTKYKFAAPFLDPDLPAVQEQVAAARAEIAADWERLGLDALPPREPYVPFYPWAELHPSEHVYTQQPGELYGRYIQLFGLTRPDQPWVLRHRASGIVFVIDPIDIGGGMLGTAARTPAAEAAARRLGELMDRIPPADFSVIRRMEGGPTHIGARGGRAFEEPVDAPTALAYYTTQIEEAAPGPARVALQLEAMFVIGYAESASPAEYARVAAYWPAVITELEASVDPAVRGWAAGLPFLAEQLGLPKAEIERAKALAERLKPR